MSNKKGPYIFLVILVVILFFILGFRAGQEVEKTNETVAVLLSIPPSRSPVPTDNPLKFELFTQEACGIELLYPATLSLDKKASLSAEFTDNNKRVLAVSCAPWNTLQPTSVPGKSEGFIRTQKINLLEDKNDLMRFQVKHPSRSLLITVEADKSLFSLIKRSLDFMK